MTSSKFSTFRARRLHREVGDGVRFPLPAYGRVQEGLKKTSTALPFPPVGARWLGREV